MSVPLPKKKVEDAIQRVPDKKFRELFFEMFHKKIPYRHGSDYYGRHHPKHAVTDEERRLMTIARNRFKLSFRTIEEIFHLKAASGNDAQRQIDSFEEVHGKKGTKVARAPRMSLAAISRIAEEYARSNPSKAKAAFKPVMELFNSKKKKARTAATVSA